MGSLTSNRFFITCARACETGPTVYRPYLRRLERQTVCRCYYKGSTFSSVIWRPWVLIRPGFEPTASRSADRRLSHWANRAAVKWCKWSDVNGASLYGLYQSLEKTFEGSIEFDLLLVFLQLMLTFWNSRRLKERRHTINLQWLWLRVLEIYTSNLFRRTVETVLPRTWLTFTTSTYLAKEVAQGTWNFLPWEAPGYL